MCLVMTEDLWNVEMLRLGMGGCRLRVVKVLAVVVVDEGYGSGE